MSDVITYSVKAKAHDLTLLNLKSQNLSELSPEELTNKYLEIYSKIYKILEDDRITNKPKLKTSF
ncbi:hypothetical protein KQH81_03170 [Clostridium cadaveris]|uniref:hypothetical protein n=1 Tax=Clostridium cadaveris TaxID=1529 RepID=UPI001E32A29C|nr:hypothetical protein [Clostridium cadaveris]UFH65558.1 hypothetical protein KQH81_03170 [Clostridium cadaveris]